MPSVIVFVVLLVVSQSFTCFESMYDDYLTHWNRSFAEEKKGRDYATRYETYCRNREWVENVNSQKLSYELDIYWQQMDRLESERRSNFSLNSEQTSFSLNLNEIIATAEPMNENIIKVSGPLPQYIDYRESGHVSSVKRQGDCGCCWAHSTVGTYESFLMLKGEQEYDLSEQYVLECTTKYLQTVYNETALASCNGGNAFLAQHLVLANGIPTESAYPYLGVNFKGDMPYTPGICDAKETIMYAAREPKATKMVMTQNMTNDQMKAVIANGPAAAVIYAYGPFQAYKSGVFSGCPDSFEESVKLVDHAVMIVGYDKDGNYIIKNSWGDNWGDKGFAVVSKDRDCALSLVAIQFTSTAAPGTGVFFYSQTKINGSSNGLQITASLLLFVVMLVMGLA